MQKLFVGGLINVKTLVWKPTMEEWVAVEALPGLRDYFMEGMATGPFFTTLSSSFSPNDKKRRVWPEPPLSANSLLLWRDHRPCDPPSSVNMASKQYMAMVDGKQAGPFAIGDLADEWGESVTTSTYVWTEGMAEWQPIAALPALTDTLNNAAVSVMPDNVEDLYTMAAGVEKQDGKEGEDGKEEEKKKEWKDEKDMTPEEKEELEKKREKLREERKRKKKEMTKTSWFENKEHTYVYVSGLPDDVTEEEFCDFMKKAGMIKEDDDGVAKIKIYRGENGKPKGDAKCCFLKDASIELAENLLNDSEFRLGSGKKVTVEKAKFEQKGDAYVAWKPSKKKTKKKKKPSQDDLGWEEHRSDTGKSLCTYMDKF